MTKEDFLIKAAKEIREEIIYKNYTEDKNAMFLDVATKDLNNIKVYNFCYIKDLDIFTKNVVFLNNNLLDVIKKNIK